MAETQNSIIDDIINKKQSFFDRMARRAILGATRFVAKTFYGAELNNADKLKNIGDKPSVIVANHITFLDGAFLGAMLPFDAAFAIDKKTYENFTKNPIVKFAFDRMNIFPVDTANPQAIKTMTKMAKAGVPVVIFPEGRLTPKGTLMQVFGGAAAIADNADADIVPIHLDGFEFVKFRNENLKTYPAKHFSKVKMTVGDTKRINVPEGLSAKERRLEREKQLKTIMEEMPLLSVDENESLMDALHRSAKRFGPDRKMMKDMERDDITYKDILTGAYALGEEISKVTERGENVGILLPNSVGTAITFWGTHAYGRVPAMLNPKAGIGALTSCLDTAQLKTVLTSRRLIEIGKLEKEIEAIEAKGMNIIYLEDVKENMGLFTKLRGMMRATGWLPRPKDRPKASDPATVLFTSGSEGKPKGVVLSSSNMLNNLAQVYHTVSLSPADRVFNSMPMFHTFGLSAGMLMPTLTGMHSYQFVSPLEVRAIPKLVYSYDATLMFATDTFLNMYERYATPEDFERTRIFTGAERLSRQTLDKYLKKFNRAPIQGYGMTEAAPAVSMNMFPNAKPDSVGKFLPGIQTRFEDVPGVDGKRLFIKGPNIMMGYLRPENPGVIEPPKDGWHDTGDIVKVDEDGYITLTGRAKRFAKIGGEMVALDVVEEIANAHTQGTEHENAVIIRQDDKGDHLVLFTTDSALEQTHLTKAAKEMQASVLGLPKRDDIHVVPEIPKLSTGKTDYPALQKMIEAMKEGQEPTDMRGDYNEVKGQVSTPQDEAKPDSSQVPQKRSKPGPS